jgi:AraC family transcriptional regulator, chitin signaling transcriptional activator
MFNNKFCISILFLVSFQFLLSQELPPIVKYNPATYGAGNQNWMISQDKNDFIYFANNEGLLEFNGTTWSLYPSPNETIIRSVNVINNKIYTGCYMEFGYWIRQSNGQLKYTSLSKSLKNKIQDDEQFWNILNYDQWVIFQSLNKIFIYDTKSGKFNIIAPKNGIVKSFRTSNAIYYQSPGEGLFEIENGESKLISNNIIFQKGRIVSVFSTIEGLLIQTQSDGLYKFIGGNVSKSNINSDPDIATNSIYSCKILSDGSFALGTVSKGIYIVSKEGKVKYHITQNKGLSNNTVLSLFEDADKNLWLGLDNGINCINIQSPVRSFSDNTGILGTVYASIVHQGKLYIGTNQGLFWKSFGTNDNFQFVNGTKGQVWSLFENQGTLFCGHDSGTFIINSGMANCIFSQSGTWKFTKVPNHSNLLLQGNYYGVSVIEKINDKWVFRNKIVGFDYSSRYFEVTNSLDVYVSHEYKGVFRFRLDQKLFKTNKFYTYKTPTKGKNASLVKFNNRIYYAFKDGIMKLNSKSNEFEKDNLLSSVFENDEYTSGKMIVDNSNKIWLFSKNYIHYFTLSKLSSDLKQNNIPIPAALTNSMLGFENITQISNYGYLIGTTDGYYTMNINDLSFKNYNVSISNISVNKINEASFFAPITQDGEFKHAENNVTFNYAVPEYNKYINAEYQYFLEGVQDEWSEWNAKSTVSFKNLSPGEYTFQVRAKIANSSLENMAKYTFVILKPWYATNFAIIFYLIVIMVLAHFINKAYKNYYYTQREKLIEENNLLLEIKELENSQELMKIRNEQLTQDVDNKNKELAVSTMSLIKKNELLSLIKDDLKNTSEETNNSIKSVIKNITKNISEEDSWTVFKEAFDNADKDFFKESKIGTSFTYT